MQSQLVGGCFLKHMGYLLPSSGRRSSSQLLLNHSGIPASVIDPTLGLFLLEIKEPK